MPRGQGGTLSGFTPLSTPSAPTIDSVSTPFGSAEVSFTAPADTGDGAITSYIVTAINESTGASFGATGSASPISVSPSPGGTFKIRMQAVNGFGPGRLSEFSAGHTVLTGLALYGWGYNGSGQVGDLTRLRRSSPVQVGASTDWQQAASGANHSAAIKIDGTLWAWGQTRFFGQVGDGLSSDRSSPVQIGALTNWSQVAAGNNHTVAVKTDGTLWSWGRAYLGALGDGTTTNKSSPVQVGALTNWAQVSAGDTSNAAIKTDGTLWTWGYNNSGRLGDGTTVTKSSPVQVGALTNWAQVSAGGAHMAAVKTDGTLWAWGAGSAGRLGDGTTTNKSSPVQVGALTNWAQVSAGNAHTAAIKTTGTLWAWGDNSPLGQLGDNTIVDKSSPVQIGALTNWSQVSAGRDHTVSVKTDGTIWVWGGNAYGQLGDDSVAPKSSPVQVGSFTSWNSVGEFAANGTHTLAILGVV